MAVLPAPVAASPTTCCTLTSSLRLHYQPITCRLVLLSPCCFLKQLSTGVKDDEEWVMKKVTAMIIDALPSSAAKLSLPLPRTPCCTIRCIFAWRHNMLGRTCNLKLTRFTHSRLWYLAYRALSYSRASRISRGIPRKRHSHVTENHQQRIHAGERGHRRSTCYGCRSVIVRWMNRRYMDIIMFVH